MSLWTETCERSFSCKRRRMELKGVSCGGGHPATVFILCLAFFPAHLPVKVVFGVTSGHQRPSLLPALASSLCVQQALFLFLL